MTELMGSFSGCLLFIHEASLHSHFTLASVLKRQQRKVKPCFFLSVFFIVAQCQVMHPLKVLTSGLSCPV